MKDVVHSKTNSLFKCLVICLAFTLLSFNIFFFVRIEGRSDWRDRELHTPRPVAPVWLWFLRLCQTQHLDSNATKTLHEMEKLRCFKSLVSLLQKSSQDCLKSECFMVIALKIQ